MSEAPDDAVSLHHVSDGEPTITRQLLRAACAARGIAFVDHRARQVDWSSLTPCRPGDLVHRSAGSLAAILLERYLCGDGVATVGAAGHGGTIDPWPLLAAERAGVPVVVERPCGSADRGVIRQATSAVGGLPVVVKVPDHQGGIGVMLAESWPALFGLLDHLRSRGTLPVVSRFVPDATTWRCVVLGDDVVAAHVNELAPDDFRSTTPASTPIGGEPGGLRGVAIEAARAMGLAFAGVDLVVDRDGSPWVLEANSPCFFAPSQTVTGVDIAGALVAHLLHRRG